VHWNFFKENDLTFCTIDQPQIGQAIEFDPIITNDKAYIRFHGRNVEHGKNLYPTLVNHKLMKNKVRATVIFILPES
jgi:uncharacterized protein YecE (DUF72 family)